MEVAIIVPLIVFASIVIIIATPFYFRHRNRKVIYDAIKTSVEKTGEADPKLIAAITHDNVGPNTDLRRGILLLAFATALAFIGVLSDGDEFGTPLWAIALIPGLIGAAYIALHFFAPREPTV
jgi:fructose-specific phosphotransferase system IIC component